MNTSWVIRIVGLAWKPSFDIFDVLLENSNICVHELVQNHMIY